MNEELVVAVLEAIEALFLGYPIVPLTIRVPIFLAGEPSVSCAHLAEFLLKSLLTTATGTSQPAGTGTLYVGELAV